MLINSDWNSMDANKSEESILRIQFYFYLFATRWALYAYNLNKHYSNNLNHISNVSLVLMQQTRWRNNFQDLAIPFLSSSNNPINEIFVGNRVSSFLTHAHSPARYFLIVFFKYPNQSNTYILKITEYNNQLNTQIT